MQQRIHAAVNRTVEERYESLIKSRPGFLQRFPQNMIAPYLGITPRIAHKLKQLSGNDHALQKGLIAAIHTSYAVLGFLIYLDSTRSLFSSAPMRTASLSKARLSPFCNVCSQASISAQMIRNKTGALICGHRSGRIGAMAYKISTLEKATE